jgi:stage II sporulation protein P
VKKDGLTGDYVRKGQRWFRMGKKRVLGTLFAVLLLLVLIKAWNDAVIPGMSVRNVKKAEALLKAAGQDVFRHIWERFYPAPVFPGQKEKERDQEPDPAYRTAQEVEGFFLEHEYLAYYGNEETWEKSGQGTDTMTGNDEMVEGKTAEEEGKKEQAGDDSGAGTNEGQGGKEAMAKASFPGQTYQLAQLEDYDFLMSHFYNVHTSTTADRQLMDAKKLLSRNFQLFPKSQENQGGEEEENKPQILIYHTHSQETFADSGPGQGIVEVGAYLAELLEEKGFSVYHDRSVYDVRDGKLDRNKAYTYALEGIRKILEENPSIQVVIDLHRDGVKEGTRLVTDVNGKPTAQIMFFNGLSQTPEGPVPYLDNPNREDNLAFSLQLQLKAAAYYPGFTRKIYLKGLRYNQHLRPCSCLVEAGAQTNTYEEVRNAMEPLAEVFTMVLRGN